jgi:hypothetical protein
LHAPQCQREGVHLNRSHHDQRTDEVIPAANESDQAKSPKDGSQQRQHHAAEDAKFVATIHACCLNQVAGDRRQDVLPHQKNAHGWGRPWQVKGSRLVDPAQEIHN